MKYSVSFNESLFDFAKRTGLPLAEAHDVWSNGLKALWAQWKQKPHPGMERYSAALMAQVTAPVDTI